MQQYDILIFTETWLSPNTKDEDIKLTNFNLPFRNDRMDRQGGGVAIYVREGLHSQNRPDLISGNIEAVCIEVLVKNNKCLVSGFYRPPNTDINYWDMIETSFDNMSNSPIQELIILGDFNCDVSGTRVNKITHLASSYNLTQMIDEPTHFTEHSSSIIDLVLVNKPEHVLYSGVSSPFIPDLVRYHCPTVLYLKHRKIVRKTFQRHIWLYDRGDYAMYRNKLNSIDWDSILSNDDINKCAEQFSDSIMQAARESIPNKIVTIRPSEPSWINSSIKRNIRQRKRLYRKAKRINTNLIWERFKHKRNEINSMIKTAKLQYKEKLAHELQTNDSNSKHWYKLTSELLTTKTERKPVPFLEANDKIIESDQDKADLLNTFFCKQSTLDDRAATLPELELPVYPLLEEIHITNDDVREAIVMLNSNKAPGPDLISPKLLKEGMQQLVPQLQRLFNLSLRLKKFPDSWKKSNVTAIHKKDSTALPGNYRPISLLNYNGKLMERCVHKHLTKYFTENNVISPYQSGFVSGDSTLNQLLYLSNEFYKALDGGKEIRIIFCDISKAFDRVWHKGLIYKLKSAGLSGSLIDWLSNYLENRLQRVCLNNCTSTWQSINAGVPQGSILGPLLFLIFINDIVKDIRGIIRLFADDTILFDIVEDPLLTGITLNVDLSRIFAWAKQWLVEFQPIKQESFIASKKRVKPRHPPLYMGNTQIKEVDSHKHLGIELANDMSWKNHINTIVNKAYLND